MNLLIISLRGIFNSLIKYIYKSSESVSILDWLRRSWSSVITCLFVFNGEIILPLLSITFLKYCRSNLAFFNFVFGGKYKESLSKIEGSDGVPIILVFILFFNGKSGVCASVSGIGGGGI